jgi:hypothetical protein
MTATHLPLLLQAAQMAIHGGEANGTTLCFDAGVDGLTT